MAAMYAATLEPTPDSPSPYRVVVRWQGEIVRVRPVASIAEGNRALVHLLRSERDNEREHWAAFELDS
jgi:hypothetical protein